jgi:hypothetical protein
MVTASVLAKWFRVGAALAAAITLTACGSAAGVGAAASGSDGPLSTSYPEALAVEQQLMLGTMALDGTSDAVTSDQASTLLTLWKAYQSLQADSSASDVEIQALVQQIEGTMTDAQLTAIADRQLTAADSSTIIASLNLSFGRTDLQDGGEGDAQIPFSDQVGPVDGEGGGGFRGGEFPGGGFGQGGGPPEGFVPGSGAGRFGDGAGSDADPEQIATQRAERRASGDANGLGSRAMLFPLIQYLTSVAGASG